MLDVSVASNQSKNIAAQLNNLANARSELVAYKMALEMEYSAGEVPTLITKINNAIAQLDDAKNKISSLANSVNNTAAQIRREQEEEAARQEAARREAARQEAARQEAARQEAARQEAARQQTAAATVGKTSNRAEALKNATSSYKSAKETYDGIKKEIDRLVAEKSKFYNILKIGSINSEIEKLKIKLQQAKTMMDIAQAILNGLR